MSNTTGTRDPLIALKAIIIGLGLGFITVALLPYFISENETPRWLVELRNQIAPREQPGSNPKQTAKDSRPKVVGDAGEKSRDVAVSEQPQSDKLPASGEERPVDGGLAAPPSAAPADTANAPKAEPEAVLIPAVQLKFPKTFTNEELSEALKPLLSFKLSEADVAALKEVLSKGQSDAAKTAMQRLSDPSARKFAEWHMLRGQNLANREVRSFRAANPLFPAPFTDAGSETSLFLSDASSADVLKVFANKPPRTGAGKASFGAALLDTGERERGLAMIRHAWSRHDFDDKVEARLLSRFGNVLNQDDHNRRKTWLAARARKTTAISEEKKSKVTWIGLKGIAKLRAKRGKGKPLHVKDKKQIKKGVAEKKERASKLKNRGARGAKALRQRGGKASQRRAIKKRKKGAGLLPQEEIGISRGKSAALPIGSIAERVSVKKPAAEADKKPAEKEADTKSDSPAASTSVPAAEAKPAEETQAKDKKKPDEQDKSAEKAKTEDKKSDEKKKEEKKTEAKKQTAQQKAAGEAVKLAKETAADSGAILNRLKALRKQDKDERIWSILRSLKPETADIVEPEKWWEFRRTEVRKALNIGYPTTAYAIASARGALDGENLSEAEFLAGWIALRFLKQPEIAEKHFEAARPVRGVVRDEARTAYWLAMTKIEMNKPDEAKTLLNEAATRPYVYYGQIAKHFLDGGEEACEFRSPHRPTEVEIAGFLKEDAFKAVMIIKQLDISPLAVSFFLDLAREISDPAQMTLLFELAERIAPPQVSVRAAKIALLRGFAVEAYAFPTLLPKFDPLNGSDALETAVLHALTRQESEFHSGATSPVGAKGLMQLMPGTAKLVATSNKLKYEPERLTSDPSYNVTLGSAYLVSLLSSFDGSYVLSLASYNAGPGRIGGWVRDFGDPRRASVDPIDWVERIPFTETRNYVQRIMESIQLYRCRFESGKVRLHIMKDLHRGRAGKVPDLASLRSAAEKKQ